jgi:hypothetical protein
VFLIAVGSVYRNAVLRAELSPRRDAHRTGLDDSGGGRVWVSRLVVPVSVLVSGSSFRRVSRAARCARGSTGLTRAGAVLLPGSLRWSVLVSWVRAGCTAAASRSRTTPSRARSG